MSPFHYLNYKEEYNLGLFTVQMTYKDSPKINRDCQIVFVPKILLDSVGKVQIV